MECARRHLDQRGGRASAGRLGAGPEGRAALKRLVPAARFLGIDIGTSGLRIAALGEDGDCLWLEKADWPATVFASDTEQDPQGWWQSFDDLMQLLGQRGRLAGLRAIAFAGTSGTVLT